MAEDDDARADDTSLLDYELPDELVAQQPAGRRGDSRLLVVRADAAAPDGIGRFADMLPQQLEPGDLLVANDSRVLHARLHLRRPGGGAAELLLVEPHVAAGTGVTAGRATWSALARPARRLREGMLLELESGDGEVRCRERLADGSWVVELPVAEPDVPAWLVEHGEVPLPPYVHPGDHEPERYQTVYASRHGSVAAPTAGLHFDDALWQQLRSQHEVAHVTLHVGPGTFRPVQGRRLAEHPMHHERYEVPAATDAAVRAALRDGRRVVAVGTTSTRVLESVYGDRRAPLAGSTDLFIRPGYEWRCVGALLTNFHLPRSTLLALVMSFAGVETMRAAYRSAIEQKLRFFSFGDACFLHGRPVVARRDL